MTTYDIARADREHQEYEDLITRIRESTNHFALRSTMRRVKAFLLSDTNPVYAETVLMLLSGKAFEIITGQDIKGEPMYSLMETQDIAERMVSLHSMYREIMDDNA